MVGQDIDQRGALHPVGVVEAHARDGAGAAIMPGGEELAIAELLHHLHLVLRHRAERVVDAVRAGIVGADAVAIAAQIGGDDMEMLGEPVGDLVPGDMRHRVAVQQQQRRPVAAVAQMDTRPAEAGGGGLDIGCREALEHGAALRSRRHRSIALKRL